MKSLKYLSYVGKFAGLVTALDGIPFVDPKVGVIIFAAASLLKDTANRTRASVVDATPFFPRSAIRGKRTCFPASDVAFGAA